MSVARARTHTPTRAHSHSRTHTHARARAHTHTHTPTRAHTLTREHTHTPTRAHTHSHTHRRPNTSTHPHIHIPPSHPPTHAHKHTHKQSVIPSTVYSHNLYSVVVTEQGDSSTPALHSYRGPSQRPPPIPEKHTHPLTKKENYHKHSIYCNTTVTVDSVNQGSSSALEGRHRNTPTKTSITLGNSHTAR